MLAVSVAGQGLKRAGEKELDGLIGDLLLLQDEQAARAEERLGRIAGTVEQLRNRPFETARLHLQEAAAPDAQRDHHLSRARDSLLEAYAAEPDPHRKADVASNLALVKALLGEDTQRWWTTAVTDIDTACDEDAARVERLLGTPHYPPDDVPADQTKDARKRDIKIGRRRVFGFDDQTKFWYLVGQHLDAFEAGEPTEDSLFESLPQTQAIRALFDLATTAREIREAAVAAGTDLSTAPRALDIYLGRRQNAFKPRDLASQDSVTDAQAERNRYPRCEFGEISPEADRARRELRRRRRLGFSRPKTVGELRNGHPEVFDAWTVQWLLCALGDASLPYEDEEEMERRISELNAIDRDAVFGEATPAEWAHIFGILEQFFGVPVDELEVGANYLIPWWDTQLDHAAYQAEMQARIEEVKAWGAGS